MYGQSLVKIANARSLLCAMLVWITAIGFCQDWKTLTVTSPRPFVVLGTSFPIVLDYTLGIDDMGGDIESGLPSDCDVMPPIYPGGAMGLNIRDWPWRRPWPTGAMVEAAGPYPRRNPYPAELGDHIVTHFELTEAYQFTQPGECVLHSSRLRGEPVSISLLAGTPQSAKDFAGGCALPLTMKEAVLHPLSVRGSAQVCTVQPTPDAAPQWFLILPTVTVQDHPEWMRYTQFAVKPDSVITAAAVDYRWQLWISLTAKDEHCLVLWNLLTGEVKEILPWDKRTIEFGTVGVSDGTSARSVVAGFAGETKTGTLVYGWQ